MPFGRDWILDVCTQRLVSRSATQARIEAREPHRPRAQGCAPQSRTDTRAGKRVSSSALKRFIASGLIVRKTPENFVAHYSIVSAAKPMLLRSRKAITSRAHSRGM